MDTIQYRTDISLLDMKPLGYKPTRGATGDVNLVDYTPSKYDKNITVSDLSNLDNIRANRTNQQTWQILGGGIIVLVLFLIFLGFNKKSIGKNTSNINPDNINDGDLFNDYNDKNQKI